MKSLFYLSLVAAGMFAVHANGQSLYTLAGPVGLEESLPLKWFFNLAGGYDDNVNASNYNKQESAFISTDIGCSLANYDAVTQYSFSAKLGGIFYLKDLDGGTNEALSNSTLSAKLSHSFDQTLRYNGSVSFAWQPEPNYSNGIANARRDGDYIYVYVSSSVSKAWTSRYSTTLGANFSMIDYQEDSAKTDNRDYVGMNFTNRYKWTERLAVSLGWTGSYCNREYGNNEFSNFVMAGAEYAVSRKYFCYAARRSSVQVCRELRNKNLSLRGIRLKPPLERPVHARNVRPLFQRSGEYLHPLQRRQLLLQ